MRGRTYADRVRAWVVYSVLRVLAFAVPFAVLYLIGLDWWIAALGAAVIGFCLSYILLRPQRDRVARQLAEARSRSDARGRDEVAEDVD